MRRSPALFLRWSIVLLLGTPLTAAAQGRRATASGPESSTYTSARAQAARIPSLDRSIAVDLEGSSLEQALSQIAARTGLRLTYSTDLLPEEHRVSLHASRITASDAVLRVLRGTTLDLLVSPSGHAVLVECSPATCGPRVKGAGPPPAAGSGQAYARLGRRARPGTAAAMPSPTHGIHQSS